MPRRKNTWCAERCRVCHHPQVGEINYALASGVSGQAIAAKFNLSPSSVYNHARKHISATYRKVISSGVYCDIDAVLKACATGDAQSLDLLNAAISGTFNMWSQCFANADRAGMTQHVVQLRGLIELRSKITRELAPAQHYGAQINNILVTGDISTLMRILEPWPDAKAAIVAYYAERPMIEPSRLIEHAAAD